MLQVKLSGAIFSDFLKSLFVTLTLIGAASSELVAQDPDLPPPKTIGSPTIWVNQEADQPGTVRLANGTVISTNQYGQPLTHPLALAIKLAHPGDVIACQGELNFAQIGKYDPNKPYAAFWPNGAVIENISIVAEQDNVPCVIRGISIMGNVQIPGAHGVNDLTFKKVTFKNMAGSATPFIVSMNGAQGKIRLYDVKLTTGDPSGYSGFGMKWGIRANSAATWDVRKLVCAWFAQEHCLYLDSVGGGVGGDSYFLDVRQKYPSGRTGMQFVERASPNYGSLGLPTQGDLYIRRARLNTTNAAGGGSALTVAGHSGGSVYVKDLRYKGSTGAVAFWVDAYKGVHFNSNGFPIGPVYLEEISVRSPSADRNHIAVSGAESVTFRRFRVLGNRTAIDLNSQYGGPYANGTVNFIGPRPLSQYSGFMSSKKIALNGQVLSDTQIDSIWP